MKTLMYSKFIMLILLVLLVSCEGNKSNGCKMLPYFCSFEVNGNPVCYESCFAMTSVMSTSNTLWIQAGNIKKSHDSLLMDNRFFLIISNASTGIWNKDSIGGLNFYMTVDYDGINYVFPAFQPPTYEKLISDFNVTITTCDTINGKIEGLFYGILAGGDNLDSIIIENGEFSASFAK